MSPRDGGALVTGAGQRLGRAFAVALGQRGMRVAVHYNSSAKGAQQTAGIIIGAGGRADVFQADLSQPDGPKLLIDAVRKSIGSLDVVVNSAAGMARTPFGDVTPEQWDPIFALNLRAPFFVAQHAARIMGKGGVIVNIADLAAFETWPGYVPHAISKAGVVKMTESLAKVLAPNIRVNAIAPGAVLLPEDWDEAQAKRFMATTPLEAIGKPEDAVAAMLYLIDAEFVTGETIVVDGGRRIRK